MKTSIEWTGKMSFSGTTPSGHEIKMDAAPEVGGENTGARPTELLLQAVAGCTAIDIVSILQKMRLQPLSLKVDTSGERAETFPKRFTDVHIHYILQGDLPDDKVARAIKLSKDTYCSVSNSLNARVSVSYEINGIMGQPIE
ncbi:OsmC family protein [Peribacillus kribbensis]|uniref:OsmC family protein n=1 Tax=Peribacillus kribbensis TaxID=356658 RepID=UPI00041E2B90|nr:OsmC family protein [Peribacillus kribbensis]